MNVNVADINKVQNFLIIGCLTEMDVVIKNTKNLPVSEKLKALIHSPKLLTYCVLFSIFLCFLRSLVPPEQHIFVLISAYVCLFGIWMKTRSRVNKAV